MHINRSLFGIACRAAAFSFLVAGTASLMHAQQAQSAQPDSKAPFFLASSAVPDFTALISSLFAAVPRPQTTSPATASTPARRHLTAPSRLRAADTAGPTTPTATPTRTDPPSTPSWPGRAPLSPSGITHRYETPSWDFQVGGGRNFSKSIGVLLQFDYDHFGLQGATLANQQYIYNYGCSGVCDVRLPDWTATTTSGRSPSTPLLPSRLRLTRRLRGSRSRLLPQGHQLHPARPPAPTATTSTVAISTRQPGGRPLHQQRRRRECRHRSYVQVLEVLQREVLRGRPLRRGLQPVQEGLHCGQHRAPRRSRRRTSTRRTATAPPTFRSRSVSVSSRILGNSRQHEKPGYLPGFSDLR